MKIVRIAGPIPPANKRDPTGVDRLERGAIREFAVRIKRIASGYIELLSRIPTEPAVNQRYTFQLDPQMLSMMFQDGSVLVDGILLADGEDNWLYRDYISTAYQRGTAQEHANLAQQSPAYAADRDSLQALLLSDAYRHRVALVRARAFEGMKGVAGDIKKNLARVLADGIARGLHPREVAKNIREQAGIERVRASRIARTEVTTALRRARWDEHDDAIDSVALRLMLLHISALSATTRIPHALRHAHTYTSAEVREWYSINANAINCKCSQISILVNEKGEPVNPRIVEMLRKEFRETWGKAA